MQRYWRTFQQTTKSTREKNKIKNLLNSMNCSIRKMIAFSLFSKKRKSIKMVFQTHYNSEDFFLFKKFKNPLSKTNIDMHYKYIMHSNKYKVHSVYVLPGPALFSGSYNWPNRKFYSPNRDKGNSHFQD